MNDDARKKLLERQKAAVGPALLEAGKKPGFKQATYAIGNLGRLAKFCKDNDPKLVASGLMPTEHQKARALVSEIDAWLCLFIKNIAEEEGA